MDVPEPLFGILHFIEEADTVTPRQRRFVQQLLDEYGVGKCLRKGAHVEQVGTGESRNARKGGFQVSRQMLHDLLAPTMSCLSFQNLMSNLPVKQD